MFGIVSILLLLLVGSAQAIQAPGAYFISHPKWRCEEMLAEYRRIPELAVPIIFDTPGKDLTCFNKLLALPNLVAVEIHLINETCFPERGRRCQKFEVAHGYSIRSWTEAIRKKDKALISKIQAVAARAAGAASKVPDKVRIYISALLESNLGAAEGKMVIDTIRPYFQADQFKDKKISFVWNPVKDVGRIPDTHYELHGYNPRLTAPCIYNNDGSIFEPIQASYYLGKYPQCDISAFWTLGENCLDKRYFKYENFVEIPNRLGCNRQREFREIVDAVLRKTGPAPSSEANPADLRGCKATRNVLDGERRGFIWKQMEPAEGGRRCGGKPSNGAVVLVGFGDSSRSLKAYRNGKEIESFCSAGDYSHDPKNKARKVWRSNKNTPDFPAGTVLKSDKGVCWVLKNPAERID